MQRGHDPRDEIAWVNEGQHDRGGHGHDTLAASIEAVEHVRVERHDRNDRSVAERMLRIHEWVAEDRVGLASRGVARLLQPKGSQDDGCNDRQEEGEYCMGAM